MIFLLVPALIFSAPCLTPVIVNEVFPRATPGEPEWLEIVNTTRQTVNLKNWTFGNDDDTATIVASDCALQPGEFLVITSSTKLFGQRYPAPARVVQPRRWHSLDNYNDTLILSDPELGRRELIIYHSSWFPGWKYQSIERVSAFLGGEERTSWVCAAVSSPGQPNAAISWRAAAGPVIAVGPTPFSPDNDGTDDRLSISIDLPSELSGKITIYSFSGKKVRTFATLSRQLFWDGRSDDGRPGPAGPFFVVLETISSDGAVASTRTRGVLRR
ncbi:MAG: lamin tail domain-containing protein [Chitinispirillaceae bacterium]|jgi:hypothetical protein|nr:lamin tail domain-containing protein [Chitinispirillaceae bacterium]